MHEVYTDQTEHFSNYVNQGEQQNWRTGDKEYRRDMYYFLIISTRAVKHSITTLRFYMCKDATYIEDRDDCNCIKDLIYMHPMTT